MGVSGSGFNFENSVFDGQKRDIESTTSEIEDEDILFSLSFFIQTISDGGGGGFIDDS
jgi:hypothetical protein